LIDLLAIRIDLLTVRIDLVAVCIDLCDEFLLRSLFVADSSR